MDESDEDKVLLEDDSMDEMHELEDNLMASIDTNASPVKASVTSTRRRLEDDDDEDVKGGESDESELFDGSSSSSDESDSKDESTTRRIPHPASSVDSAEKPTIRRRDEEKEAEEDEEDDEPPEIPGSPLRTMTGMEMTANESARGRGGIGSSRQELSRPTADILTIQHEDSSDSEKNDDDEYETKEAEGPRAMEFHASSSSSESEREATDSDNEDGDGDGDDNNHHRQHRKPGRPTRQERPKTAAKELALYRGVVPTEYFEQIVQDAPSSPKKHEQSIAPANASRDRWQDQERLREAAPRVSSSEGQTTKYKVRVPQEIEELFQYVDAFSPDEMDIPTRIQPFIPEYVPAVGLPFDGVQIPRPDSKRDAAGIAFVREPCAQSNAAELELLLAARAKNQRRKRRMDGLERVHSIEGAANRPREIDNWISSVAKVHVSKPLPQVQYKKPMPSETSLMELWPEAFEVFLSTQPPIPLSKMDLDLADMLRVVCGILDIPVYDGLQIHSLHALFSLFQEVVTYEKEMLGKNGG